MTIRSFAKLCCWALAFILALAVGQVIPVKAAPSNDDLKMNIVSMTANDNDTFNVVFTLENTASDYDLFFINVNATYPGSTALENLTVVNLPSQLTPGQKVTCEGTTKSIAFNQLGKDIIFTVNWQDPQLDPPDNTHKRTVSAKLPDVNISLSHSASTSNAFVKPGETIKFTYTIKNSGSLPLTNIKITDFGESSPVYELAELKPGETKTAAVERKLNQGYIISDPALNCTYKTNPFGTKSTSDVIRIYAATNDIKADITADKVQVQAGEKVSLKYRIVNNGNQTITIDSITDQDNKNVVTGPIEIKPGIPWEEPVEQTMPNEASKIFTFSAIGKDSIGTSLNILPEQGVEVRRLEQNADKMQLNAAARQSTITSPQTVTIDLEFINNTGNEIQNVTISLEGGQTIKTYDSLPVGKTSLEYQAYIEDTASLIFTAKSSGFQIFSQTVRITLESNVSPEPTPTIEISPTPGDVTPSPTIEASPSPEPQTNLGNNDVIGTLIYIVIIMLVLGIAAIVVFILLIRENRLPKSGAKPPVPAASKKTRPKARH